jgi:hypothetical protein
MFIGSSQAGKMHTLALLDIKVKEPDFSAMMRGQTTFLPPRFMTVNQVPSCVNFFSCFVDTFN